MSFIHFFRYKSYRVCFTKIFASLKHFHQPEKTPRNHEKMVADFP